MIAPWSEPLGLDQGVSVLSRLPESFRKVLPESQYPDAERGKYKRDHHVNGTNRHSLGEGVAEEGYRRIGAKWQWNPIRTTFRAL